MRTKALRYIFVNGPIQNGDFTFSDKPGKAVGIRISEALNRLLGSPAAPHLWNTVTLTGDLRYQRHISDTGQTFSRMDYEASIIARKYGNGPAPAGGIVTDAEDNVANLAMEMIARRLGDGSLAISHETMQECVRCGHMGGLGQHRCKACGGASFRPRTAAHLVADRKAGQPALDFANIYARRRRPPLHLRDIAANVPSRLILSRTRDHGIDLGPIGLRGLVLDPRAGIHITAHAVAASLRFPVAVMTTTQNAAANIAAYGHIFTHNDDTRLLYALHGRVPYQQISSARAVCHAYRIPDTVQALFETWFLPLFALKEPNGIDHSQMGALMKYFWKAYLLSVREQDHDGLRESVRDSIEVGNVDWIMNKAALAAAMKIA